MRRLHLVAVPATLLLAACGGESDITVTNENNVVLNDALENHAFTNDGETTNAMATDAMAANAIAANAAMANETVPTSNAM